MQDLPEHPMKPLGFVKIVDFVYQCLPKAFIRDTQYEKFFHCIYYFIGTGIPDTIKYTWSAFEAIY